MSATFPLRYGWFRPLLSLLGAGPRSSGVHVGRQEVRVRMGWSFRADIARSSITAVEPYTRPVGSIGVHGWNGQWLVNGAVGGLVRMVIDPPGRARVLGVPVRLRTLVVSVEWPEGLIAALTDDRVEDHGQHD